MRNSPKDASTSEVSSEVMARVKIILQRVYASLGEEFADGEKFDGAVVCGAVKRSILVAMRA
eukprot:COSAG02_NODE_61634_length_268_cov_0.609467_1_plen_62_part_10